MGVHKLYGSRSFYTIDVSLKAAKFVFPKISAPKHNGLNMVHKYIFNGQKRLKKMRSNSTTTDLDLPSGQKKMQKRS